MGKLTSTLESILTYFNKDCNQIEVEQHKNAKEILRYAMRYVPYYQRIIRGHVPEGLEEFWDYWRAIPPINRQTVKSNFQMLIGKKRTGDSFYKNQTSGSTGHPIQFLQCQDFLRYQIAGNIVASKMTGYESGDKQCFLWGSLYNPNLAPSVMERLENWITRTNHFDLSIVSPSQMRQMAIKIYQLKPDILYGYPSVLVALAKTLDENRLNLVVKSVESCGEPLMRSQRRIIERAFSAPMYDKYGAREVGTIAHECSEHQGMHLFSFNNLVEIVNTNGEPVPLGKIGRIVVTNLHNHAMPLIRYDIGDYGRFVPNMCTCGFNTPLIGPVEGRESDTIVLEDGTLLFPDFFYDLFCQFDSINKYQIVQESPNEIVIYFTATPELAKSLSYIEAIIKNETCGKLEISIHLCNDIPRLRSGKHRYVISQKN